MLENTDERTVHDVMRARLTLALVSRRANSCPNKACARKKRCLARLRNTGPSVYAPMGACRNMSEEEWRIVGLGMRRVKKRFERYHVQKDAEWEAALNTLPKKMREEIRGDMKAIKAERAEETASEIERSVSYFEWLWLEDEGLRLGARKDVAKANAEAIAWWADRGVTSALEIGEG